MADDPERLRVLVDVLTKQRDYLVRTLTEADADITTLRSYVQVLQAEMSSLKETGPKLSSPGSVDEIKQPSPSANVH